MQEPQKNNDGPAATGLITAPGWRALEYAALLKPRLMALVVFSAWTGMMMAPGSIAPLTGALALLFIAAAAAGAAAIKMWYDRDIDAVMAGHRPLPAGRLKPPQVLACGLLLAVMAVAGMAIFINPASAQWLAAAILYYLLLSTMLLKRRTPQNVVIGGLAGALPPVIGWVAVSGGFEPNSIILSLIIFLWTPPHAWALALFRGDDYKRAGVPMMPNVVGVRKTKIQMLIYTLALVVVSLLPTLVGMAGRIYGVAALALGIAFTRHAIIVLKSDRNEDARRMFFFSIFYLFLLFAFLLLDKAVLTWGPVLLGQPGQ